MPPVIEYLILTFYILIICDTADSDENRLKLGQDWAPIMKKASAIVTDMV